MHAGRKPPVQDREAGEKTAGSRNRGSEGRPGEARLNSRVERKHAEQEDGVEGQDAKNTNETSRLDRVKSCWQDQEKLLRPTARTRRVQEQLQNALGVPVCTLGLYCLRFAYRWNLPELFYFPEVATPLPGRLPLGSHRELKSPALCRRVSFLADPEKSERERRLARYVEGKTFVQNGENKEGCGGEAVSLVATSKASSESFPAPSHQQASSRKYDCLSSRRTLRSPERAHWRGERIMVDADGREGDGGAEAEEDTARSDGEEGEKPDEKGDTGKRSEERELPRGGGQGNEAGEMPARLAALFKPEERQGWEVDHLINLLRTTLLIEDTGLLLRHRTSGGDNMMTSQQAPSHRATGPASRPISRGYEASSSIIPRVFEFPSQDACVDATVVQVALLEHQRRGEWGPFPSAFSLHRSVLTAGFSTHSAPSRSPGPSCSRQSTLRQTHPVSAPPACAAASLSSLPASCTFPTSSTPGSSSLTSFPRFSPDVAARDACISEASASLSPSSLCASASSCPRSFPSSSGFSAPSLRSVSSVYSSAIPATVSPFSLSTSRALGCLPTVSVHSWNGVNLFLKTPAWQRLYERIGSRLMMHLLTFTCLFVDSRLFSLGAAPSRTWPALAFRSPSCLSPLSSRAASRRPSPGASDASLDSERGDSKTAEKGGTRAKSDEREGDDDECDRELRRQTSDDSTDTRGRQTREKRWGRLREEKTTRNGENQLGKKKHKSRLIACDPNGEDETVKKEAKGRKRCRGRSRGERRKKKLQCQQAETCATDSRPPALSRTDGSSHPSVCLPCGASTSHSLISSSSSPACSFPSLPLDASCPPSLASCSTAGAASRLSHTPQSASRFHTEATHGESLEAEERRARQASTPHEARAETGRVEASLSLDLSSVNRGHQPPVKQVKEELPRGEGTKANAAFKEKTGAQKGKANPSRSLYIQISGQPLTQARLCELRHIHCLASRAAARQRVRNRNAKQARQRGGDGSESEATGTVDREVGVPGAGRHEDEKKKAATGAVGEAEEEGEDRQRREGDDAQTDTRAGQEETPGHRGRGNGGRHATSPESGEVNLETETRWHRVSENSREEATSRSFSPPSPRPAATVPGEAEREKEMDGCKSRRDRRRLMALLRRRRRLVTREAKRRSHLHRRLRSSGASPSFARFSDKREASPVFLSTQSSRQSGVRPSILRLPRQLICHHSSFNKEGGLPNYALMSTLALRSTQRAAKVRKKGEAKHAETTADGGRSGEPNRVSSPTRRKGRGEKLLKEATSQREDKEDVKEKDRGGDEWGEGGIEARILTKFVLFSPLLFSPLTSAFGRRRGAAKVARAIGERTQETREVLGALRRRLRQMRTNVQQGIERETQTETEALSAQPQVAHGNEERSDEEQRNRTWNLQREAKEAENEEKNEAEMEKKMLKHVRQRLTKSVAFKSALSRWLLKGFKELLARYRRCNFLRLLRRHCPAKRPRRGCSYLSCRGDCSLSSRGSRSSSPASLPNNVRFASSRGPRASAPSLDASGCAPSPSLSSPPPSAPSSPSSPLPSFPSSPASLSSSRCERLAVLRLETPPDRVIAFLLAALRRIVPPQLLGGQRNFRLFLKRAKQFALLNSRESVTLHMLLHSMKMRPYTALASRSSRRQSRERTAHAQSGEQSRKANGRSVEVMRKALQRVQKAGETLETEPGRETTGATRRSREKKGRERVENGDRKDSVTKTHLATGKKSAKGPWKMSARSEKGKNAANHERRGVKARGEHDLKEGRERAVKEKAGGRLQEVFLSRIVFFLFTQLVIPLLRQHFYVTEAEPSAHRMRFFRKIAWLAVEQQAALSLHRSCFALDSHGDAEERRGVRGLAENAGVSSAPASAERSVLKPGACLSKRQGRSRRAENQRPEGGPKETEETAKKGTRSLEKAEKHGGLRRTRLSWGSPDGSREDQGVREEDKEERGERDRAKRRREEVSAREAERQSKRWRHERREETEAVFEGTERRANPEEVEGGRGGDGGAWARTGRQSDQDEEDENDDWLAQEIEDYVNPEILTRVQEISSVPIVRFLPKVRGCRPLVNLSQPHSGVLLAHLLSAALERMEKKAKEDRERRQAARQRWLKVLRDAGAFSLLFGDTWAGAGGSGDAAGNLLKAAKTGRGQTEDRRPEAGEHGGQQGGEDSEREGKELRKRVVQMVVRNLLRAANREKGSGLIGSIGKGGIEDEKQLLAHLPGIASSFLFHACPSPLPPPFPSQSYARFVRQRLGTLSASLSARQLHARHPPLVWSSSALRSRLSSSPSSSSFFHSFSSFHTVASRSRVCATTRRGAGRVGTVQSFSLRDVSFPALRKGFLSDRRAAPASQRPPGSPSVSRARPVSSPAVFAFSSPSTPRPSSFAPRASLSLNSLTSPIRSSLAALCRFHPSVLGCSVLSFSDVHRRLLAWWSFYLRSFKKVEQLVARFGPRARVRRVSFSQIFFVVGDLQACYEGLTHAELLRSVQRALARANVQKMHVLKLYKRVVSPPVPERARGRGGGAASRDRRQRRQGRGAHEEIAETRRPGRTRERSRGSEDDGNEANLHTGDARWVGREESGRGRGRETSGDREERETETRGSGGREKDEAREKGRGRVAGTRRDSKQREGERGENRLKKARSAEGREGGEREEEERNVKRVKGVDRVRQTETAHFASIGRVDEVAVPARDGRQPLLATLLLPAGRDKRKQETAETSVSSGALSRARAGQHVRFGSAHLPSRERTAVRMDATSSSRCWSMSFSSSSRPDSRSLPSCIASSSFDSSFSASLPFSSSFSCAPPFPESSSRVSAPDAAAVFRRRLLRGSSSGGVVLLSDSNQRLMLDSRELLLSVRLLLRHHRIRFCQRRQPFHSPTHHPGFPPVQGERQGAALEAAADPPGDKRKRGSDPPSQPAFGTQEEAAKRSGEQSSRETDGEPESARQRLSLGRKDGRSRLASPAASQRPGDEASGEGRDKAGTNLRAKDWHQAGDGQPGVGSEGRAWSTEGVGGGQKKECPGRERDRNEEANGVYRQTIGIPQGSNISGLLCALFYADRDARPEVQALLRGEDTSHRARPLQLFARARDVETDAGEALHARGRSAKKSGEEDRETNRVGVVEDAKRFGSEEKKSGRETEERDKREGGDRKDAERRVVFFRHVGPLILEVARKTRGEDLRTHNTSSGLPVSSDSSPSCPSSTSSSSPAACASGSLSSCSPSHSPPSSSLSLSSSPSPHSASSSSSSPSSPSSRASFCRLRRSEREALHALERELSRLVWPPLLMRWVDDFLFLSPSRAAAEAFLSLLLEQHVWGKNVNRQKLKTDLFDGSWSSTAAVFQKRSGERSQAEADAPGTPSAASSAASAGTQSERDAVSEVAVRCEGEAQESVTRLRSGWWKKETHWGAAQNFGRINEEMKPETEFSGVVGDHTKSLGRSDAGDMTVGRRKRTRPEEGSTTVVKMPEARKKSKRDTSSVGRKAKTPSHSPTYSSLQIYPPSSSLSFTSTLSSSRSSLSFPSPSSSLSPSSHSFSLSSSSLPSSSSSCASASAPSGSGPCWAGVRFSFDVQRRGFCVLPLLRRDVAPGAETSGSLSEARERGRRAKKETLGDTSVQSSIRDSLALQRGKRAFLARGATANGAEFMAEMLEQRLLGHLAMRLGTTRVFVDLRLNSPEAACRNVYVVVKTAFLKLRCGLERIAKEFAGFLRPAYILDLCMRLIDAVLSYTRQPIPFQWRSSPTVPFSKGMFPSSRSVCASPSSSSSSPSASPPVLESRGQHRGLSSWAFQQRLRFVCFNAAASVFRGFQSSKRPRTVTQACGRQGTRYSQNREEKPHSSFKATNTRMHLHALCSHCAEISATTSAPCLPILSSRPPSVERLAASVSSCRPPSVPSASACPAPSPQKSPHSASSPLSSDSQSLPFSASGDPGRPLLSAAAVAHAAAVPVQKSHPQKAPFREEEKNKCAHAVSGPTVEEDAMKDKVNDEEGVCLSFDSRLIATVVLSDIQALSSRSCKPQIAMDLHASLPASRGSPVSNPVRGWEEARDDESGRKQEDSFSNAMGEEREARRDSDEKESALCNARLVDATQMQRVERKGRPAERDPGSETGGTDEEGCEAPRRRDETESERGTGKEGQERRDGSASDDEQDRGEGEVGKSREGRGKKAEVEQEDGREPKQAERRRSGEARSFNRRQSHEGLLSHRGATFTDEEEESFKRCYMRCGHVSEISQSSETSPGDARCAEGERGFQKNREKGKGLPFPLRSLFFQGKTKGQKAAEQKKQSFSACFAFFASKAKLAEVALELRRQGRAGREPLRQHMQPGIVKKHVREAKRRKTEERRNEKMEENTDKKMHKMKKKSQEEETETTSKEKTEKNVEQGTKKMQDTTAQEEETEERNTGKRKEAVHNFEAEAGRQSHIWTPCETAAKRRVSDENPRGTEMEVAAVDEENRDYSGSSLPSQETTLGLMDQKKRHKNGKVVDAKPPQRGAGNATDSGDARHVRKTREDLAVRFSGSSRDACRMPWRRQSAENFACTQKRGRNSEQKLQDVGVSERAALRGQEKEQEERGKDEDERGRKENPEKEDDAKEDGEKVDGNEPCPVETKPVLVSPEALHATCRSSASLCTSFLTKEDGLSPVFACEGGRSFSSRSATEKALLEEAVKAYLCAQRVEKEEGDRGRGWPPVMRVASRKSAKRRRSKSTAAKMTSRD